jgi:preprotein translocase subunit YajC
LGVLTLGCVLARIQCEAVWGVFPGCDTSQGFDVFISQAHAQTATTAASGTSNLMGMLPLVLMFVVLYFVMIRPQMKRQKELKAMLGALSKGDEVATQGGVLGKISKLGDTIVSLEVASGVEVQVQRASVTQVLPKGSLK